MLFPRLMEKPSSSPDIDVDVDIEEETTTDTGSDEDNPWRLILYNDEVHTFDEVINQLIKALGCSLMKAEELTYKVHTKGKAMVYEGSFEECFQRNTVLKEIQLVTEIKG